MTTSRLIGAVLLTLLMSGCSAVVTGRAFPITEAAAPAGPVGQVEVFVGDGAKKILDIDRRLDHVITPLPAIGDEAYEEDGNLFIRKGQLWASIRLVRINDPAENRDPLRTAAKQVADRM